MIPWKLLDRAVIPDVGGELRLMQRGLEYSIMLGANELMNSRLSGSEEALATLTATKLKNVQSPQILIGGLGMGFTLRAALAAYSSEAKITVAELVPAVVTWAQHQLKPIFGECMDDPRVRTHTIDVFNLIREAKNQFHAILLDVDNGPDGLTHPKNDRLYNSKGVKHVFNALVPGGLAAIWSARPDDKFTKILLGAGFGVEEVSVRGHRGKSGAKHHIWLASKPMRSSSDSAPL